MTKLYVPGEGLWQVDQNEYVPGFGACFDTHYQYIRPNADSTNSGWQASSGSDLYAMIDEETPSDTDYIYTTTASSNVKIALTNPSTPSSDYDHVIRVRCMRTGDYGLDLRLYQGTTLIDSIYYTSGSVKEGTPETIIWRLDPTAAASITDYSDLYLYFGAIDDS